MTIGKDVVVSTNKFKYLRVVIQSNEELNEYVTHRTQAGWLDCRAATEVFCDRKLSIRLKG